MRGRAGRHRQRAGGRRRRVRRDPPRVPRRGPLRAPRSCGPGDGEPHGRQPPAARARHRHAGRRRAAPRPLEAAAPRAAGAPGAAPGRAGGADGRRGVVDAGGARREAHAVRLGGPDRHVRGVPAPRRHRRRREPRAARRRGGARGAAEGAAPALGALADGLRGVRDPDDGGAVRGRGAGCGRDRRDLPVPAPAVDRPGGDGDAGDRRRVRAADARARGPEHRGAAGGRREPVHDRAGHAPAGLRARARGRAAAARRTGARRAAADRRRRALCRRSAADAAPQPRGLVDHAGGLRRPAARPHRRHPAVLRGGVLDGGPGHLPCRAAAAARTSRGAAPAAPHRGPRSRLQTAASGSRP